MKLKKKKRPSSPPLGFDKTSSRSKVRKGPARDEKHLAKVRAESCIACRMNFTWSSLARTEAHHVRCIGARTLGKRVSDYLTVPLCQLCHRNLHSMNETKWWAKQGINMTRLDPAAWISAFSEQGRKAIEELRGAS